MSASEYRTSVANYRAAVEQLYSAPAPALAAARGMVERGGFEVAAAPDLEQRVDAVIESSEALRGVVKEGQRSSDPDERELAELQLLAAAAMDLQVASDLVRRAEEGVPSEVVERAAAAPAAIREIQALLDVEPKQGVRALIARDAQRGVGSSDSEESRAALRESVQAALVDIRDAAATVGQKAVGQLLGLSAPAVKEAASVVLSELMAKLGEKVAWVLRKAVALIAKAIDKLLDVIGKDAQDAARKKVAEWVEALQKGETLAGLLDRVYETDRIQRALEEQIAKAPATLGAARFNAASGEVEALASKFDKQARAMEWVLRGLALAGPWLLTLQPWGAVTLPAAYVLSVGCIVYLSGDYVDWFRTDGSERLNFVPGLRSIVGRSLTA